MKTKNKDMEALKILNIDDDEFLIRKFLEGDEGAFRDLVHKHKEKIRNLVYLTTGSADAVEDISQDVFITLYRKLNKFRFDSQFTTWLYRITVNKCKDHLRSLRVKRLFSVLKEEEIEPSYEKEYDNDVNEIVQTAIKKLPVKLRVPLMLKDIQGLSYIEIAKLENCELGTVKSRIFRGRETLKKYLKPYAKELML